MYDLMKPPLAGPDAEFEHPVRMKVLTAFLKTGSIIDNASSVMLLTTVLLVLFLASPLTVPCIIACLLLALSEKYYALRVSLDAKLFEILCQYPGQTDRFDATLEFIAKRQPAALGRTMKSRWMGTKRLFVRQIFFFALQVVTVLVLLLSQLF